MFIEKQWCMFSAGAVVVLGLVGSAVGCRDTTNTTDTTGAGGDVTTSSSSGSGTGGSGGAGGAGSGGAGGQGGGPKCGGPVTTIEQITNEKAAGAVGKKSPVTVQGAVVMSQKFLVSKSSSGSCLYGVFISAPGLTETKPYSGVMVVAYGNPAVAQGTQSYCGKISNRSAMDPVPGDVIPDDIKPGDVVTVSGTADAYAPSSCSMTPQKQISFACAFEKTGTATPPAPHVFTGADIPDLNSATDLAFHDQWGGVKVRIGDVVPVPQADPGGGTGTVVVGKFGIIQVTEAPPIPDGGVPDGGDLDAGTTDAGTADAGTTDAGTPDGGSTTGPTLEVGDKLYYRGYDQQTCFKAPAFSDLNIKWTSIDGFSYLNFCTWSLQPDNKCADFNPKSEDCTNVTCQ